MGTQQLTRACLALAAALSLAGGVLGQTPATRSAVHPLPDARPPEPSRIPGHILLRAAVPPFSLAFRTPQGDVVHSRDVNRITDTARQSPELVWLGTQLGLKALDRARKTVRHYTRRDGLPGDYVEAVAADAGGVFCAVRVGGLSPDRLALCAFDPAAQRWRTLAEVSAPAPALPGSTWEDRLAYDRRGESRIALTPTRVVFAPAVAGRETETILHVFDRRSGTVTRRVGWDPGLRADHAVLGISFLWCDDRRAYVGTNLGLLSVDLEGTAWRRFLPETAIDAGTVARDGKGETRLWLAGHERGHRRGLYELPGWELVAFSPASGKTISAPRPQEIAAPMGFDKYSVASAYPRGVYVAADGGVWVTWSGSGESMSPNGGFARYEPATGSWRAYALNGFPIEEETALWRQPQSVRLSVTQQERFHTPAPRRIVPDGAALPLARTLLVGPNVETPDGGRNTLRLPALWVRLRFPEWHCPDEERSAPDIGQQRALGMLAPDPAEPGWVWAAEEDGLVRLPEADVPPLPRYSPLDGPRVRRFPIGSGARLRAVGDVDARFVWGWAYPAPGAPAGNVGFPFRFDKTTNEFTLYTGASGLPPGGYSPWMRSDGETIWLQHHGSGMYRFDPAANRFTLAFAGRLPGASPPAAPAQDVPSGIVVGVAADPADPDRAYLLLGDAGRPLSPTDPQPAILYRYSKSAKRLEPLPIPEAILRAAATIPSGWHKERPPAITGTGGLLAEPGVLWIGTTAGVFRIDKRTGVWSRLELPAGTPFPTPGAIYREPAPSGRDALWLWDSDHALRLVLPAGR